jgi:hypothetical protein
MINSALSFSEDYQSARTKFLEAAREAGAALDSVDHPERGPDGGALATDLAWFGPRDAESVMVMLSATHGAEGFCGSGAQVDWLRRGEAARLKPNVAVLLVHAINPYGFAWVRRVTHENVDLNRNWIDFAAPLPENPEYTVLQSAILPTEWTDETYAETRRIFAAYVAEKGFPAFQHALSGGQYTHDTGIWYGGSGPTWSRNTQTAIYQNYLDRARRVVILDYHTGLGPWGYAEEICTAARDTPEYRRAAAFFGAAVVSLSSGDSSSAPLSGDGLAAATALMPHAEVTSIAMEYGTQPPELVLEAVRADAWLHAHGDPASPLGLQIKQQMRDAFYGNADDWKGMVAGQSLLATRQAIAGLSAF